MTTDSAELMTRDRAARAAAIDISRSVVVKAPAGSGKTTLLAQRVLAALATVGDPEEVLAVTFTNKAANEMRARVLSFIQRADDGVAPTNDSERVTAELAQQVLARDRARGWDLLRNPSRLRIMTIDSLNSYLAGLAPIVSGLGGGAGIEERPARLYREAIVALIDEIDDFPEESPDRQALMRLLAYGSNRVEYLIPLLRSMLARRDQWIGLVIERVADGDAMVEAARKALGELAVSRMQALVAAPWSGDLATLAAAAREAGVMDDDGLDVVYTHRLPVFRGVSALALTQKGTLRKKLTVKEGFEAGKPCTVHANGALKALAASDVGGQVAQALQDVHMLPDLDALDGAEGFALDLSRVLQRLCGHLQVVFQRNGVIDFVEMGMRALAAVRGAGGHEPLAQRMDYSLRHILLDEAQDTSASQYVLLEALTGGWERGDGRSLFVVGDPQQSIYLFREAEVRLFVDLWQRRALGDLELETVELSANFRSRAGIIDFCNDVFTRSFPERDDLHAGAVAYSPSAATRDSGGAVDLVMFNGDAAEAEAQHIAQTAKAIIASGEEESIAILVRTRSDVRRLVPALKQAGVPFACQDIDPLAKTDAVRDVVGLIRALWHPGDRVAWGTLLRAPFVGLSWSDFTVVANGRTKGALNDAARMALMGADLSDDGRVRLDRVTSAIDAARRDAALAGNLADLAEAVWLALGGPACVTVTEAEDVREAFALLRECLVGGQLKSPEAFEEALAGLYATAGVGRVQIMTIHKAKGLEFDHVLLAGLWRKQRADDLPLLAYRHTEHGLLIAPAVEQTDDAAHDAYYRTVVTLNRRASDAEDLRVLYVAATRAREHLVIYGCVSSGAEEGTYIAPSGSLLNCIWPAIAPRVRECDVSPGIVVQENFIESAPLSPRLPLRWRYPQPLAGYIAPESKVVSPSEMVVRGELGVEATDDGVYHRVVGITYHELMQRVAEMGGPDRFDAIVAKVKPALAAAMRHRGMPEPRLMEAMGRVMDLAQRTVTGKNGRWILQPRAAARSEVRVSGYVDGQWVSGIIDRCFPEDGAQILIDYKSSGGSVPDDQWERFVQQELTAYGRQQRLYGKVLQGATGLRVRSFLYFPEKDCLASID